MALIESQLQDLTQIICDIYSIIYLRQKCLKNQKCILFPDELNEIMLKAQRLLWYSLIMNISTVYGLLRDTTTQRV